MNIVNVLIIHMDINKKSGKTAFLFDEIRKM